MPDGVTLKESAQLNIIDWLTQHGFDAYLPSQHEGICTSPYVVVKPNGDSNYNDFSTIQCGYDLLCYVPREKGSYLEDYVEFVRKSLKDLATYIMIRDDHTSTSHYYDDDVKAHMISIQFTVYRKL